MGAISKTKDKYSSKMGFNVSKPLKNWNQSKNKFKEMQSSCLLQLKQFV